MTCGKIAVVVELELDLAELTMAELTTTELVLAELAMTELANVAEEVGAREEVTGIDEGATDVGLMDEGFADDGVADDDMEEAAAGLYIYISSLLPAPQYSDGLPLQSDEQSEVAVGLEPTPRVLPQ